jgi:hypothetical protein
MKWPAVSVHDDEGRTIAVDAFTVVFFVDEVHEGCADRIANAIEQVVAFAGPGAFRHFVDDDGDTQALTSRRLESLIAELRESADAGEGGISLLGDDVDVSGRDLYYYGQSRPSDTRPDWRNVFSFRLSREICEQRGTATLCAFVRSLADSVPFSFAYASPCVAYLHDATPAAGVARRHPGFDVLKPGAAATNIGQRMAGIYWLSYLGPRLASQVEASPGLAALQPHATSVTALAQGRVEIRMSVEPVVGDLNRRDRLENYREAARLLLPHLHMPELAYFFESDGITGDREATRAWHRRLLDPDAP